MEARTLQLKDHRTLGYAVYGHPGDVPVLYFHGAPGSRLMPSSHVAVAARLCLRLIVPDRPGYGFSVFQPDRELLDWPDDVVQLADALEIDEFGVIGVWGGGPYAAACAYKIPGRLKRVVTVSSPAPFDAFGGPPELPKWDTFGLWAEDLARKVSQSSDELYADLEASLPQPDREVLDEPDIKEWLIATYREAFSLGVQGCAQEGVLLFARPWGFSPAEITAAIHLWHGEADQIVPVEHAHYLAQHIPYNHLHLLPGVGHFVPLEVWNAIFGLFAKED